MKTSRSSTQFVLTHAHLIGVGQRQSALAAQIRSRGIDGALEVVDQMGGVSQRIGLARTLVKAVGQAGQIPAYRIESYPRKRWGDGAEVTDRVVYIPNLTWTHNKRGRQVGRVEWMPAWVVTDRGSAPALVRPLPR